MDTGEISKSSQYLDLLACPHCGAGMDGVVLGLFWDSREEAWRCILCGHRSFEQKHLTDAQRMEEMLWDRILEAYNEAEDRDPAEEEEDPFEIHASPGRSTPVYI